MSYKTLFVLVAIYNLEIEQMDVITAFLHGKLIEIIYMLHPTGYDAGTDRVCLLMRALYDLKQSPQV